VERSASNKVRKLGYTSSSSMTLRMLSWMNRSTLETFFNTCLSAWPISDSMKMLGRMRIPAGSGFVEDEAVGAASFSDGRLRKPDEGSWSSKMQRCTRRREPSYATTTSASNTTPTTESLTGNDMNAGEG